MQPKKKPGRKPRRIDRVGIELEGGWNARPQGLKADGSVTSIGAAYLGEVASAPMPPRNARAWILDHYPDETNSSCGLHVHVSVRSRAHYGQLMDRPDFFERAILSALKRWGQKMHIAQSSPFWSRLAGQNSYCRVGTRVPEAQISGHGDRYTAVNFCYGKHGTVEIRVLPAFKRAKYAASSVCWLIRTIERYLSIVPDSETALSGKIEIEDSDYVLEVGAEVAAEQTTETYTA